MERLKIQESGHTIYQAGLPGFPRNFSRDGIISAILSGNAEMLAGQIAFSSIHQGVKKDSMTGEESGKIFHEYPGVTIRSLSTEFNACDTTALYLIGHKVYQELVGDDTLLNRYRSNLTRAVNYIINHLDKRDLFIEDPVFCNANKFSLKVTYWKDSAIIGRPEGEPLYPVVYPLAHIQNMKALRCASGMLEMGKLSNIAERMKRALDRLYDNDSGSFYLALDKKGRISGISSDSLHALFYLEPDDLPSNRIKAIAKSAKILETPIGYRTLSPLLAGKLKSSYHTRTVWPFEQALIHEGAKKFGLKHVMEVSARIIPALDTNPEIFILEEEKHKKGGCDPQLWTIAAKEYFKSKKAL
jgi:glycogen debranching enzyme